jgi:hypothetical protein
MRRLGDGQDIGRRQPQRHEHDGYGPARLAWPKIQIVILLQHNEIGIGFVRAANRCQDTPDKRRENAGFRCAR